jgi:hypothetical protein
MENIDAAQKTGQNLLNILMESMPKMPETGAETRDPPASEAVKTETQGDNVDLLA